MVEAVGDYRATWGDWGAIHLDDLFVCMITMVGDRRLLDHDGLLSTSPLVDEGVETGSVSGDISIANTTGCDTIGIAVLPCKADPCNVGTGPATLTNFVVSWGVLYIRTVIAHVVLGVEGVTSCVAVDCRFNAIVTFAVEVTDCVLDSSVGTVAVACRGVVVMSAMGPVASAGIVSVGVCVWCHEVVTSKISGVSWVATSVSSVSWVVTSGSAVGSIVSVVGAMGGRVAVWPASDTDYVATRLNVAGSAVGGASVMSVVESPPVSWVPIARFVVASRVDRVVNVGGFELESCLIRTVTIFMVGWGRRCYYFPVPGFRCLLCGLRLCRARGPRRLMVRLRCGRLRRDVMCRSWWRCRSGGMVVRRCIIICSMRWTLTCCPMWLWALCHILR